ncbi:MAG: hypothetical protein E7255_11710 [Lachnospiraceae bacterium]|nr:hypothetical protein [Lachnospiraceae bacterium]
MTNEVNNKYIENKQNRERSVCHWKLAICQVRQYPILLIFVLPIIALTIFAWIKMDIILSIFDVPKFLLPVYTVTLKILGVLIPLSFVLGTIDAIGSLFARKDETTIQMAFEEKELRNGSPILMYKRKDKKRGVIIREWHSPIPLKIWVERQDRIEHQMKEHLVKELDYDSRVNDNRILMCSTKGIKPVEEDKHVYDMNLENDLEKYVK